MSKLEVSIPYKTISKLRATIYLLLWAGFGALLISPLVSVMTAMRGIFLVQVLGPVFDILTVLGSGLVFALVPVHLITTCLQGGKLVATEEGIGIPSTLFGHARWYLWSQLKQAESHGSLIEFKFDQNKTVKIETKQLAPASVEQLLLAVEVWGTKAIIGNSLIDMRDKLENKRIGLDDEHGYTKMWEEELNRRYNSTTFVPLEPGTKLRSGAFSVEKQLAFGGFSAVYLAKDTSGQLVVIKESVTSTDDAAHQKALEFFDREALFLTKLRHERIAHVLDNFVENGRNYLVLQHIPGENLRQIVKRNGAFKEADVLKIMQQMADVLEYLHSQEPPILHRDFTPDNLVMRTDGTVVVIDFGAANEFLGNATGTLIGKQCYMPPEQVRGKCEPSSDIYALGCTATFLLTGQDPEALSVCHPSKSNKLVSNELDQLIAELTQQDSKKRIHSAAELKNCLNKILAERDGTNMRTARV